MLTLLGPRATMTAPYGFIRAGPLIHLHNFIWFSLCLQTETNGKQLSASETYAPKKYLQFRRSTFCRTVECAAAAL